MKLIQSCLFFVLICFALEINAQQKLVFTNADSSKIITIKQKDLVRLAYSGYMNQPQEAEGIVTSLNDSTITLSPRKKILQRQAPAQTLYLKDIKGFRRYSKFRPAGEIIYAVAGIGVAGTATAIVSNANLSPALSFVSAAGTAALTNGLRNAVLSSKVKNYLKNGWSMQLAPVQ